MCSTGRGSSELDEWAKDAVQDDWHSGTDIVVEPYCCHASKVWYILMSFKGWIDHCSFLKQSIIAVSHWWSQTSLARPITIEALTAKRICPIFG